ncbi:hypothetical protein PV326_007665 [Microctonus aethiopoides]|nr:hypothetical protein PV326_007665 [Microctonus aethiopoides]
MDTVSQVHTKSHTHLYYALATWVVRPRVRIAKRLMQGGEFTQVDGVTKKRTDCDVVACHTSYTFVRVRFNAAWPSSRRSDKPRIAEGYRMSEEDGARARG